MPKSTWTKIKWILGIALFITFIWGALTLELWAANIHDRAIIDEAKKEILDAKDN